MVLRRGKPPISAPPGALRRCGRTLALALALLPLACGAPWWPWSGGPPGPGSEPPEEPPAAGADAPDSAATPDEVVAVADTAALPDTVAGPAAGEPDAPAAAPARPETPEDAWSERTLRSLSLRRKVGQMIMPWVLGAFAPEGTEDHDRILEMIRDVGVGGVIMSVGSPTEVAVKLNDLQRHSDLPLLVGSDLETGAGFRFSGAVHLPGVVELGGATDFPPLMAVGATGDPTFAYEMGRITAVEARALGIHMPFAPVLDVNNNPENPVINVRSFGEEPRKVAAMGVSFVRGIQDYGALATGKHFPGHGDTGVDSHLQLPVIEMTRARMDSVELVPFRRAVDAGMEGMMTAHIAVPGLTGADVPATLSENVLTGILRREMGFDGLVVTDALDMRAVDRLFPRGEAAVRAVEAGADVLLMPPDAEEAADAVVEAVRSGRIAESRIDASVGRILQAKERVGLHLDRTVSLEDVPRTVGTPEHQRVAREIAEESLTLLRNRRNLLPLLGTRSADVLSVTYRRPNDLLAGRHLDTSLRDVYPGVRTARLDEDTPDAVYEGLERRARGMDLVVVQLYVTAVSYSGSVAVPDEVVDLVDSLERRRIPHVVVSFGNPYLIRDLEDVQAYLLAWGSSRQSQEAVGRALFGEIPIRGRLPVRIPPAFELAAGVQMPARGERADAR